MNFENVVKQIVLVTLCLEVLAINGSKNIMRGNVVQAMVLATFFLFTEEEKRKETRQRESVIKRKKKRKRRVSAEGVNRGEAARRRGSGVGVEAKGSSNICSEVLVKHIILASGNIVKPMLLATLLSERL